MAVVAMTAFMGTARASSLADDVVNNLYGMKGIYRAQYAPADWKKQYTGYDLDQEFAKALTAVQSNPSFGMSDARAVLKNFIYSMRDYHTSIIFASTEAATLPFLVQGAGDRFFIVYIDRSKLSEAAFPFQVGDELVTFDGMKTAEAVAAVQSQIPENVAATDKAMAEMKLTTRLSARGFNVPSGPVVIGVKRKGSDKVVSQELIWEHTPEKIKPRSPTLAFANTDEDGPKPSSALHPIMTVMTEKLDNPYGLGMRKTFTPDLGTKIWESDAANSFYAYIYKTNDRRLVGYIRIAGYIMPDYTKAVSDFAKIVQRFENTTDAMVIDQVNNPGGSVFYLYTLASMLTDQPLHTPLHHMSITQNDIMNAIDLREKFKDVKSDDDAKKVSDSVADGADGYPVNYEYARFTVAYADFLIDQWNQGRTVTEPYWIGGVNQINPAPIHYTKPILLLTNHLDFSGGDFFPAILQDNQRVKIFGSRTAGAGGYILLQQFSNNIGVAKFSVTGSIAARLSGNPIENLGVKPDYEYDMSAEDYQNNYAPYVKAVQTAVDGLIQ